ncbi:MAG: ATP-independent RNA helicase DbpA [Myxococcota bacterium]|jgi:ATP-independent RNA helicase DbpA
MPDAFTELALSPALLEALTQVGYVTMTPIQAQALPPALDGRDVTGQAKTGSGKTAAFALALLNAIDPSLPETQALVLCPTRELADQVTDEVRRLSQRLDNVRVITLCGGRAMWDQKQALAGVRQVVVGTPGRVGDHLAKSTLTLEGLRVLVIDEADQMLQMGFIDQVTTLVDACPTDRQTLLFSATFPGEIEGLCRRIQRKPQRVEVASQVASTHLRQFLFKCREDGRQNLVVDLLGHYRPSSALVFCETRSACDEVATLLRAQGAMALSLHGDMEQRDRTDVLTQFGNGSASVLVATNVAARGIDIPQLPLVIVSELSREPENHIHRIGRTGRAGESGLALTIVAAGREGQRLAKVEALLGEPLERGPELGVASDLEFMRAPNRTLMIMAGRKDKIRKGDVLGALIKDGNLPADAIGRIDLRDKACAVAIAQPSANAALKFVLSARIKKRRVRAFLLNYSGYQRS